MTPSGKVPGHIASMDQFSHTSHVQHALNDDTETLTLGSGLVGSACTSSDMHCRLGPSYGCDGSDGLGTGGSCLDVRREEMGDLLLQVHTSYRQCTSYTLFVVNLYITFATCCSKVRWPACVQQDACHVQMHTECTVCVYVCTCVMRHLCV